LRLHSLSPIVRQWDLGYEFSTLTNKWCWPLSLCG